MSHAKEKPEMTPVFYEPISYEEAVSKYPDQMAEICAQIARTSHPMGKYRKPLNAFDFPGDFHFYIRTMRRWTSIRKDGMDELKSLVAGMKKYDAVFDRAIEQRVLWKAQKKPTSEELLHALIDDMTMLDGAGVDSEGQPLIKLADAIKAIDARIKEIEGNS